MPPPGIGLAATQVGSQDRIVVLDVNREEKGKDLLKLVNPRITAREGSIVWEEGCLSVVDYTAEVKRAAKIEVKAWTLDQKEITLQAERTPGRLPSARTRPPLGQAVYRPDQPAQNANSTRVGSKN